MPTLTTPSESSATTPYVWSRYQSAIFDWVRDGAGDAVVRAVAGSGKTTTLLEAAKHLRGRSALFCAFNKHVQEELTRRLDGKMSCQTINSIGYQTLRQGVPDRLWNVDDNKYHQMVNAHLQEIPWNFRERRGYPPQYGRHVSVTLKAINLVRQTRAVVKDAHQLKEFIERWNLDIEPRELKWWHPLLRDLLHEGTNLAKTKGIIDYTDQVFLPTLWKLAPRQYDWVFVDECQDLSAAQIELALASRAGGGRMLFVGDPRQAIYGFGGADSDSIPRIIERTQAQTLPLSVTYRCPKVVAEQAKLYAPALETPEGVSDGVTQTITPDDLITLAAPGDLLLSRKTATAVEACLEFIARKIPATVRGREIGRQLTDRVRAIAGLKEYSFAEFGDALADYQERELARLAVQPRAGEKIQLLLDQLRAVEVCHAAFEAKSLDDLKRAILTLFDNDDAVIEFCTVHKAKGLEANRVFLLDPHELPLVWEGQADWEYEQELNLKYVAITRARETLYWVSRTPAAPLELAARGLVRESLEPTPAPSRATERAPAPPVAIGPEFKIDPAGVWHVGDRVEHPHFGTGEVLEVRVTGTVTILLVRFGRTSRLLSANVAPLKRL